MKKVDFNQEIEKHEMFFYSQLSERCKRLYVALEAIKFGYCGVSAVSQKFDIHAHTIRKGQKEILEQKVLTSGKIRQKGGGRKKKL